MVYLSSALSVKYCIITVFIGSYKSETTLPSGTFGRVAVKGNLLVATGLDGAQAVILVGKRQQ